MLSPLLAAAIRENIHSTPAALGHRIVHGGPNLRVHQIITPRVLDNLRSATHFAPLHIPQALSLIASAQTIFPSAAHFACFDDAFHQTIPEEASHFPLPQRYFDAGIRRYGFHGLSDESLVYHFGAQLPERAIFAHLGNGASLCALRDGASIDTTMGLTPTGGIPMSTRSGDLDPGVLLYLLRHENLGVNAARRTAEPAERALRPVGGRKRCEGTRGTRPHNDPKATLALNVFAVAVRKVIGAYVALLAGVDLLVFTGGIGEHSAYLRSAATRGLEVLSLTPDKIQIVPTQEERQIARHCRTMLRQP